MKHLFTRLSIMLTAFAVILTGTVDLKAQSEGDPAPDFQVDLAGGGTFKLSDYRGDVVFIFLFGNTCPYCLAAGPDIESTIYQQFKDNEHFVAVGLDTWDGSESSVDAFAATTGITFPLAVMSSAVGSAFGSSYDHLLVVDQNGILVHKGLQSSASDIDNVVEAIDESLMSLTSGFGRQATEDSPVRISPVPASSQVRFSATKPIKDVRIYNLTGKLVMEKVFQGTSADDRILQVDQLGSGIYIYDLETGGSTSTGKLLIQR